MDLAASGAAYECSPARELSSSFRLVEKTPTLKLYIKHEQPRSTALLAVRGTADWRDVKADLLLVVGRLASSARYADDRAAVARWAAAYPPQHFDWYAC